MAPFSSRSIVLKDCVPQSDIGTLWAHPVQLAVSESGLLSLVLDTWWSPCIVVMRDRTICQIRICRLG